MAAVVSKNTSPVTSGDSSTSEKTNPVDAIDRLHFLAAFTPEVQRWEADIARWSRTYDLPPELIAVVMQIESCGDPLAISSAGARGLFQVMPFHFGVDEDWMDADINAARGMAYLARSYQLANGRIDRTLAGYNGGHSVIGLQTSAWSDETRQYVYWGTGIWEELMSDTFPSRTLTEWLSAGGARLCRQAASLSLSAFSVPDHPSGEG